MNQPSLHSRRLRDRLTLPALVMGAAFLVAACDNTGPTDPADFQPTASLQAGDVSQETTPAQLAVAQAVPGFGGYFMDADGKPAVYLTDPAERPAAEAALAGFLESRGFTAADLRVLQGQQDYLDLDRWYTRAWPQALAVSGAVSSEIDESANRLRFRAATSLALLEMGTVLRAAGVPSNALIVERGEPVRQLASLRDRVRPVHGGYQINFFASPVSPVGYVCTMGFNAIKDGANSFITNSHCTNMQGGTEIQTEYYQASRGLVANPDNFIGLEVDDPHYWYSLDCPVGFSCRHSDAARGEYAEGIDFQLGRIARPAIHNDGSLHGNDDPEALEIDGRRSTFRIVSTQSHSVMGEHAHKVGRTTGWTSGEVVGTCVNTIPLGSPKAIVQLCQTRVQGLADSGDSGSPVFRPQSLGGPGRSTLLGILWGGSADTFVFSPMSGIERDLGGLQVH